MGYTFPMMKMMKMMMKTKTKKRKVKVELKQLKLPTLLTTLNLTKKVILKKAWKITSCYQNECIQKEKIITKNGSHLLKKIRVSLSSNCFYFGLSFPFSFCMIILLVFQSRQILGNKFCRSTREPCVLDVKRDF